MGRRSAHEKNLLPGKSHIPVSQPRGTPSSSVTITTPLTSRKELRNNVARRCSARCAYTSLSGVNRDAIRIRMGISTSSAMAVVASCQVSGNRKNQRKTGVSFADTPVDEVSTFN